MGLLCSVLNDERKWDNISAHALLGHLPEGVEAGHHVRERGQVPQGLDRHHCLLVFQGLDRCLHMATGGMVPLQIKVRRPLDESFGLGLRHQIEVLLEGFELREEGGEEVVEEDVSHRIRERLRPLLFLLAPLRRRVVQSLCYRKLVAGCLGLQKEDVLQVEVDGSEGVFVPQG